MNGPNEFSSSTPGYMELHTTDCKEGDGCMANGGNWNIYIYI